MWSFPISNLIHKSRSLKSCAKRSLGLRLRLEYCRKKENEETMEVLVTCRCLHAEDIAACHQAVRHVTLATQQLLQGSTALGSKRYDQF